MSHISPAALPGASGAKAISSTPSATQGNIARTCSAKEAVACTSAKVVHCKSRLWLTVMRQSAVTIAARQTHASKGSSHSRMKQRTIAPPKPVSSRVCRRRRTRSFSRFNPVSARVRSRSCPSVRSAAQPASLSPGLLQHSPSSITVKITGAVRLRRRLSSRRKRSISGISLLKIQGAFCQSPRTQRCRRLK